MRLDIALSEISKEGVKSSGGIILFMARTPESRKNIENRRRWISQLILWSLEGKGNITPLPRLCMALDVHGNELVKASSPSSQFRDNVLISCSEIETKWDSVPPPDDYDGPSWQ
jgi:hypothetical protein